MVIEGGNAMDEKLLDETTLSVDLATQELYVKA